MCGNFLRLSIPNPAPCPIFRCGPPRMDAESTTVPQFHGYHVIGVDGEFFAQRQNFHLHGREPNGECSRVVLDQDAEETLDGTPQRAMDHERLVAVAVFSSGIPGQSLAGQRRLKIELHGCRAPLCQGQPMASISFDVNFPGRRMCRFAHPCVCKGCPFLVSVVSSAAVARFQSSAEPA